MPCRFVSTRRLLNQVGRPLYAAGVAGALLLWSGPASAQTAYFSIQGELVTVGDQLGVGFNLSGLVTDAGAFGGETFTDVSRANRAGQFAPSGLDSELVLFDSGSSVDARNDDGGPGLDGFLTWAGLDDVAPNTSSNGDLGTSLAAGDYTLNVEHFSNGGTGSYAVDLFGPVNLLTLTGLDPNAGTPNTTTITSLAMGTSGVGQDEAIFDYNSFGTLSIDNTLDLDARSLLDINSGAVTVGGTTTIHFLGELQLDGGTFNANGPVNVDGGWIDQNSGTFNLAAGQTLTATDDALVDFTTSYELDDNTTFSITDGSDFNIESFLDIGNGTDGTFVVSGSGSTVDTNETSATFMDWGTNGASAVVTAQNDGVFRVNSGALINLGNSANTGTQGTMQALSGGDFEVNSINAATGSGGTALIRSNGNGSTITQSGASTLKLGSALGGATGVGALNISFEGVYNTGTGVTTINDTGTVTVFSQGVFNVNGDLVINGGTVDIDATSTFTADGDITIDGGTLQDLGVAQILLNADNKNLLVTNGGQVVTGGGTTNLLFGQTATFQTGSDWTHTGKLNIGNTGGGTLTLDGSGSDLIVSNFLEVAVGPNTGVVNIQNDASATTGSLLVARSNTTATTDGEVNILSAGTMTTGSIAIGDLDGNQGQGAVRVNGSGSTLTQTGSSSLVVGNADTPGNGGTHILGAVNSGVFNSGTGTITVANTGVFGAETGGTVNANGPINVVGGLVAFDNATFNLAAGQTLTASAGGVVELVVPIYNLDDGTTFNITDGSGMVTTGDLLVGSITAGTLEVDGAGSLLFVNSDNAGTNGLFVGLDGGTGVVTLSNGSMGEVTNQRLRIADSGNNASNGTVNIQSGATLTVNGIEMATLGQATAALNVSGAGSTLTQTGTSTFEIGSGGTSSATVNVTNSGVFNTGTGLTTINENGTLNINTAGEININGDITVDGGMIDSDTTGFDLAANTTLTAQNNASVTLDGEDFFIINNAKTFAVQSGADLSFDGALSIEEGVVTVDGIGSSLIANTDSAALASDVGAFSGAGILTLSNDATGEINVRLHIASTGGTSASTAGTLNVQSGADLTLDSLRITHFNSNAGTGVVNLDGAGSTITQTGSSDLIVGNNVAGTATINVTDSAVFTTGTGPITINKTGTLNVDTAGAFNANGDVLVDGGTVNLLDDARDFNLAASKSFTARNSAQINFAQDYDHSNGGAFQVESGADVFVDSYFDVDGGALTLDGAGTTFSTNQASNINSDWGRDGTIAVVTASNGAQFTIGGAAPLMLSDTDEPGSQVNLLVLTGAGFFANEIVAAPDVAGTALISVNGTGSSFTQSGASPLTLGSIDPLATGSAQLTIADSGVFSTGTGSITINPTGTLNINTGGTFNANADIAVNGGTITTDGTANAFNLIAGGTLNATNDAQINFNGPRYTLDGGRTFSIGSGSDFTTANGLDIGNGDTGTLIVDGAGSTLDVNNGSAFVGLFGGSADATLSNGAVGQVDGIVYLASLGNNAAGTIDVESGASLTLASLDMASDTFGPSDNATANVTVSGTGSTITQTGSATLAVGGTGTGSTANLTVASGGGFNTGTGTTTVNPTGTINLVAGTFNANGDVVINGGSLDLSSGTANLGLLDLNGAASVALVNATLNANTIDFTDIGSAFNFNGGTLSVNSFIGILDQNGGTLAPGQSPGTTSISGYNLNSGSIAIEIGGTTPGTEHDEVQVGGTLALGAGSILDVTLINAFTPDFGDSFDILDFVSVLGSFAQVNLPMLSPGLVWADADLLTTGELSIALALPGDTDLDGDIDDADLGTSFSNFTGPLGSAGGKIYTDGDTDGDGDVDDADLATAFAGFTGPLVPTNVPEPGGLLVFAVGALITTRRRQSRVL